MASVDGINALTSKKWDESYRCLSMAEVEDGFVRYRRHLDYLARIFRPPFDVRGRRLLEIGCGLSYFSAYMAQGGCSVLCVDRSQAALARARDLFRRLGIQGYFVRGDLRELPLAGDCVDLIYGGGVIEHVPETQPVLTELARVLAPGGFVLNTVPAVSAVTLTYYQRWGSIPDLPLVRALAEFIHMGILRGRHMSYGYEKSFTVRRMRSLHAQAGLVVTDVGFFEFGQWGSRRYAPLRWLLPWRPFWNVMYIAAVRP